MNLDTVNQDNTQILAKNFDSFDQLFQDIKATCKRAEKKYGKFTNENIKLLYKKWIETNNNTYKDVLIYSQLKWAISFALKNSHKLGETHKDQLISLAFEAVIKAVETFDPEMGTLSTWFRKLFLTKIITYGKENGIYFSQTKINEDNYPKVISLDVTLDEDGEMSLSDTMGEHDNNINKIEEINFTGNMREIISQLPLREKELLILSYLESVQTSELGERLTPITVKEYEKLRERGHNKLTLSFTKSGKKYTFEYNITAYYHNSDKNSREIDYSEENMNSNIKYQIFNTKEKVFIFNFICENMEDINLIFNGKSCKFTYKNNETLIANLHNRYGSIFSNGSHALDICKKKLRMNNKIINLKNAYYGKS